MFSIVYAHTVTLSMESKRHKVSDRNDISCSSPMWFCLIDVLWPFVAGDVSREHSSRNLILISNFYSNCEHKCNKTVSTVGAVQVEANLIGESINVCI